uniref:Uncharacterized protein n=1 Tax=Arundo donax TaxID=35708 RepID=A0A0A9ETL8_ARUDO
MRCTVFWVYFKSKIRVLIQDFPTSVD